MAFHGPPTLYIYIFKKFSKLKIELITLCPQKWYITEVGFVYFTSKYLLLTPLKRCYVNNLKNYVQLHLDKMVYL